MLIDLLGKRFGTWTVLAKSRYRGGQRHWMCQCDCGVTREVQGANLRNGGTTNCGCQRRHVVKHGASRRENKHRLYRIWKGMRTRCGNPNIPSWKDYGARGIRVCDEWNAAYEPFRDWAAANGYS